MLTRGVLSLVLAVMACAAAQAAAIRSVKADGTGTYPTIQAAIDVAAAGDEVVLQPGTYTGDGNRDIDFRGKAITVRSTNPRDPAVVAATVVDCQAEYPDCHRGFLFASGETASSILSGLTIRNGQTYDSPVRRHPLRWREPHDPVLSSCQQPCDL